MPSFKSAIALLLCFTVRASPDLFSLEQDSLIITPEAARAEPTVKPAMQDPYFMENDSYLKTEAEAVPAGNRNEIEAIVGIFNRIQADAAVAAAPAEPRTKPDLFSEDDVEMENIVHEKTAETFRTSRKVDVADSRRPVYGVLTEPLRGDMVSASGETVSKHEELMSYIPKA